MGRVYRRREVLKVAGGALLGSALTGAVVSAQRLLGRSKGCVVGQPEAARVGDEVLAAGGNAVDAAVAAALVAGVVSVQNCGIGGYGGHMVIALAGSKKVTAIDFNSAAPAAARDDMFPQAENGEVKEQVNIHGWLAAGVPGTLAGMELALDRYGTKPFRELVHPAIRYAREGFEITTTFSAAIHAASAGLMKDPASARLLMNKDGPLKPGGTFRNPELADLLEALAERNSVDSFYRGDIGQRIAAAFQKHGGLVTAADMAAYHAREVEPLELNWRGYSIRTAPLTAGGATVLETLSILKALRWDQWPLDDPRTQHARLEAMRIAWDDRLKLLADPEKVKVPIERLLSERYAQAMATRVEAALRARKTVVAETDGRTAHGTIHLSAVDAQGTMIALTLTHGGGFGAQVTVDGLGLILGHGMSRFDPRPGRPNSPGPGKRPLNNMCPTVVLREGQPILALGGGGGRKIPNAISAVLAHCVGRTASMEDAISAPRMHTEGGMRVTMEARRPKAEVEYVKKLGYMVENGSVALVHAVAFDPKSGSSRAASR